MAISMLDLSNGIINDAMNQGGGTAGASGATDSNAPTNQTPANTVSQTPGATTPPTPGDSAGASTVQNGSGAALPSSPDGYKQQLDTAATSGANTRPATTDGSNRASTSSDVNSMSATSGAAPADVANWYRSTLGRNPDQEGLDYWNKEIAGGTDPSKVYQQFVQAAGGNGEYVHPLANYQQANTYTGPANGGLENTPVAQWGVNVLGTAMSPADVQKYNAMMEANPTVAGAYNTYNQFLQDHAGQVRNNLDFMGASQLNQSPIASPSAVTYQASTLGTPTQFTVSPEQTVAGQLRNLYDPNNPLIQQAQSQAMERANAAGLLNSSMAAGAATSAAYQAALPVAQQDANTYNTAMGTNVASANTFAVDNQNAINAANQFNASAVNNLTGQQLQQQTALGTSQISANAQQQTAMINASSQQQVAMLDNASREQIQKWNDANTSNMRNQDNTNALNQSYMQWISNIQMSTMDADAKQNAINLATQTYQTQLALLGKANPNIPDVSGLLTNLGAPVGGRSQASNAGATGSNPGAPGSAPGASNGSYGVGLPVPTGSTSSSDGFTLPGIWQGNQDR